MKKNVMKTMVAAVCVVAAGMGGFKAYNATNQSEADMLLSENVEALSAGDDGYSQNLPGVRPDCHPRRGVCFWDSNGPHDGQRFGGPNW